MRTRHTLRRIHIWMGWLIGLPLLFWTLSGVVMVARPIEEVRGTALLADSQPMRLSTPPVPPPVAGLPIARLSLEQRASGPRWVATLNNGNTRLADPATGRWLPPVSAADAAREVMRRYQGKARLQQVVRIDAARPPMEYRRDAPAWAVHLSDGTHFYVDAGSGEVVARRTRWWRFYDWMWGLHIMDLDTREDTHNPWVIGFGAAALVGTLLALVLLPFTLRRRRRSPPIPAGSAAAPASPRPTG